MGKDKIVKKVLLETCIPMLRIMKLRYTDVYGAGSIVVDLLAHTIIAMEKDYSDIIIEENKQKAAGDWQ